MCAENDTELLKIFDLEDLIVSTTSYYIGRQTILVSSFCGCICDSWSILPKTVQGYIQNIVERAYAKYDRGLKSALGSDCERKSWDMVRALWKAKSE